MIKKNNKWLRSSLIITTFLIFTLLVLFGGFSSEQVYAEGVDSIVFEVNGQYVQASMDDWAVAFYAGEGNALYDYVSPVSVIGFESAGVYYDFASYAVQFYEKDGVFADAIAQTDELDPDIVDMIKFWPISEVLEVKEVEDIAVDIDTGYDDIPFPEEVEVELFDVAEGNEDQEFLDVVWADESEPEYDPDEAGTYTFEGELVLPDNVTNPDNLTASVEVIVSEDETIVEDESWFEKFEHEEVLVPSYQLEGELKVSDEVHYLEFAGDETDWARPDEIIIADWDHVDSDNDFFIVSFTKDDDLRVEDVNENVIVTAKDEEGSVLAVKAIPIEGI